MSHNEKHTTWQKEFLFASLTGFLFGSSNTIVGHPFDTVKTKMQSQSQHMGMKQGYFTTVKNILKQEGPIGFYRGVIPPLIGSTLYRSA